MSGLPLTDSRLDASVRSQEENTPLAAQVLVSGLPQLLSYRVSSRQSVRVGMEVTVEVGRRLTKGWVVALTPLAEVLAALEAAPAEDESQLALFEGGAAGARRLKEIHAAQPAFLEEQLPLFDWMAEYYGHPLIEVIDCAVPRRTAPKIEQFAVPSPMLQETLNETPNYLEELEKKAPLQAAILGSVIEHREGVSLEELRRLSKAAGGALKTLAKRGFLSVEEREEQSPFVLPPSGDAFASPAPDALTPAQQHAVDQLEQSIVRHSFSPFLLFGVTGSGKTEVYLRAIRRTLELGRSALVVIPEISLTPQFIDQFTARLKVPIALLHSQVGVSARWRAWDALRTGEVRVAIGARSAVFAPLPNLGLVIVDEEHESSYKQSDGLRYHARDVAVMRAKLAGCTVVLGSATPSFESLLNVRRQRYQVLELPERVSTRPMPALEIIDMRRVALSKRPSPNLSPQLYDAIKETLEAKGQVVILYNKRGFASFLQCETCSEVVSCSNCSVPLTYHQRRGKLLCHYCNLSMQPPSHCRFCRNPETSRVEVTDDGELLDRKGSEEVGVLSKRGAGTEKVVEELAQLFPDAAILRMDRDTVSGKDSYREILGSMRSGRADILVGTQMIAKGHDLPGVTLVGIIDADVGLHMPDFRASEKAYQLITQAAGRAGRGSEPGRVYVQTREPEHPTIVATVTNRFKAFARYELEFRKKLEYPPLGRLLRVVISSTDREESFHGAEETRKALRSILQALADEGNPAAALLGPAPAPLERLRGRFRWHILVKSSSAKLLSETARRLYNWRSGLKGYRDLRVTHDIDPVEMM